MSRVYHDEKTGEALLVDFDGRSYFFDGTQVATESHSGLKFYQLAKIKPFSEFDVSFAKDL